MCSMSLDGNTQIRRHIPITAMVLRGCFTCNWEAILLVRHQRGYRKYCPKQRDTVVVCFTCVAGHSGARVMKSGLNWETPNLLAVLAPKNCGIAHFQGSAVVRPLRVSRCGGV